MFRHLSYLFVSVVLATVLVGCHSKVLSGDVVDNFGKPVPGATVRIENSAFETVTDDAGKFELEFAPGSFEVVALAAGHMDAVAPLSIAEKTDFPMSPLVLTRIPPEGIHVCGSDDYIELKSAGLEKVIEPKGHHPWMGKLSCVGKRPGGKLPIVEVDALVLFADPPGEKPWKLARLQGGLVQNTSSPPSLADCGWEGPDWFEVNAESAGSVVKLVADVEPGSYCLTKPALSIHSGYVMGNEAACFEWRREAAETEVAETKIGG